MGWPVEKLRAELALGPNSARSQAARERASMNYYPKASWAKAGFGTPEKFAARNQTPDRGTAERSGVEFFPPLRPITSGMYAPRLQVTITLLDGNGSAIMGWQLDRAMPVKFKFADLSGKGTEVGIEELHLVHEGLSSTDG